MKKKKPLCLKRFGFLTPMEIKNKKPKRVGRQASARYYLKDIPGVYLTSREFEISFFISTGCTVREIANKLELSHRTVEFYLTNARRKLGVRNKQELVKVLFDNDFFKCL